MRREGGGQRVNHFELSRRTIPFLCFNANYNKLDPFESPKPSRLKQHDLQSKEERFHSGELVARRADGLILAPFSVSLRSTPFIP